MPLVTIAAVVVFIGYAIFVRVEGNTQNTNPSPTPDAPPIVIDEENEPISSPSPTANPTPQASVTTTTGNTTVKIQVDTNSSGSSDRSIVYPGASKQSESGASVIYETSASGDEVYDWYKSQLESKNYQIRNNVRTKANDKFKGVLQGVGGDTSIKVTIDQESASAKTVITLE